VLAADGAGKFELTHGSEFKVRWEFPLSKSSRNRKGLLNESELIPQANRENAGQASRLSLIHLSNAVATSL
jgi:hypothetical protein